MTAQEFTGDQVKFTVNKKPGSVAELEIEASSELVSAAYGIAVRAVCKQVVLPGFRKGRAPEMLVLKNYPNEINKKWQEEIALKALEECKKTSDIAPLHRDSKVNFSVKKHDRESGATLTLSFEVEPAIPTIDPKLFQPKEIKRPEVSDQKVEETMRQIRFFYANWKTIEDRPVEEGDLVILDVAITETEPARPLFNNTRFEVSDASMAKWMKNLVIGKKPGDSMDGVSTPDDSLSPEEKEEFKPKKVRVMLKKIEQADLPPLDDAFAQKLGVKTVADLREQITRLLHHKADAHVQEELRKQASQFLLSEFPFELPYSLIEKEMRFRMNQLMHDPEFQKYWDQMTDDERKNTAQSLMQQSEKAVRMFYLCRKILDDQKITVTPQDLPAPATNTLEILMQTHPAPHEMNEMQQAEAFSRLILEKAEDFVIANAGTPAAAAQETPQTESEQTE